MEPFKNIYNKESITKMAHAIIKVDKTFNQKEFIKDALKEIDTLEMKERVDQITLALEKHLKHSYTKNISILIKTLAPINKKSCEISENGEELSGFILWPYTRYAELYGLNNLKSSLKLLYEVTKRFTSEFGIRPFIEKYPYEVFATLENWKKDKNHHVRRLVSEGTRPNLPWGIKVQEVNENLERNIKLILSLHDDPSEYVRKSVANHLNDISRMNEKLFIKTLKQLKKQKLTKERTWLITHASRSLLKKGSPAILKINGFEPDLNLEVSLKLGEKKIKEGDYLPLKIDIKSNEVAPQNLIIDYIINYPKKNGAYSPKAFRLKKTSIQSEDKINIIKKHHFKKVTTRVHYKGKHFIQIQINGTLYQKLSFTLT